MWVAELVRFRRLVLTNGDVPTSMCPLTWSHWFSRKWGGMSSENRGQWRMQCREPHPFHCARGVQCSFGCDTRQGCLLDDRQMLETMQPATPVARGMTGVITDRNSECAATVPVSPGALIAANRLSHFVTDSESECYTQEIHVPRRRPSRLVLVPRERPGDGIRGGARFGRSTRHSQTEVQSASRDGASDVGIQGRRFHQVVGKKVAPMRHGRHSQCHPPPPML